MVVGINSIGLSAYYERLFERSGLTLTSTMKKAFDREDKRKAQHYAIKTSTKFKIKGAKVKAEKITQEMYTQLLDTKDGRAYRSGMALDDDGNDDAIQHPAKKRKITPPEETYCKYCGTKGHNKRTVKACLKI
jgi:hypothetical protein